MAICGARDRELKVLTPDQVKGHLFLTLKPHGATRFTPPVSGFGHTPGFFLPLGAQHG